MHYISAAFFVWAGLIIGISFVATPVKFLAPNLPIAHALSVGRVTFHALGWVELVMFLGVCVGCSALWAFWEMVSRPLLLALAAIGMILAVQYLWLMPILDARLLKTISGEFVEKSNLHQLYIAIESLKLLVVLAIGILLMRQKS